MIFSTFFSLSLNFAIRSSWSQPQSAPGLVFADCTVLLHLRLCCCAVLCLVTQSSPTLCNPMDCSSLGSSAHGDSPGKNTEVGCHGLLQGIFPTQGSNAGLSHCRRILYQLRDANMLFKEICSLLDYLGHLGRRVNEWMHYWVLIFTSRACHLIVKWMNE